MCGAQWSTVLYDNWSRRDSNKTDIGEEGTVIKLRVEEGAPIKLKLEQKELQSLLCVEKQSTVLYDNWSRRDSNKTDIGEEGIVIKLRVEEGAPIKLKPEQKELRSLLCVEQQSTVLYDTWSRRNSNKPDIGEEETVIKLS